MLYSFEIERSVYAPVELVWAVVSDVVGYADVAPNLSRAEVLEGSRVGMRRRCYDTDDRGWNERCVLWEEGRRYSMEVDTSDYPYPFKKMQGTWSVEPNGRAVTIRMRFDFIPKYGLFGRLLVRLYALRAFQRISEKLLDNWEARIRERAEDGGA